MPEDVDKFISTLLDDLKTNRLKLPTLPQVAIKVGNIIDDPKTTTKEIAKIISTDAALTARLIQVANSVLYRGISPVEDIRTAVTRLGIKLIRNIVTSLIIRQLFHTKYDILRKRMEKLWLHSAHVAAISYVLAGKYTSIKPDEALLGGLIHNIGELPILTYAEKFPSIADSEETLDNISGSIGPVLGKTMLQAWKFPPSLIIVAAEYTNIQRSSPGLIEIIDIVVVAKLHSYIGTQRHLAQTNWATIPAFNKFKLTPEESISTLQKAREEILEIQKLLTG